MQDEADHGEEQHEAHEDELEHDKDEQPTS
jgi:hypothetical protein